MTQLTAALKVSVLMMMTVCLVECTAEDDDDVGGADADADADGDADADSEEISTYTIQVSLLVGEGDVVIQPNQQEYEEGQLVSVTADPDTGWMFKRWGGDFEAQTESKVNVKVEQNISIEAYFVRLYSLTVETEGQGEVIIDPEKTMYEEGDTPTLEAVPAENWVFDHWTGNLAGTANPETLTMNADKTVTAVFVESP